MAQRIRSLPDSADAAVLETLKEKGLLPFAVPEYWLNLASEDYRNCRKDEEGRPLDPILAQALPSEAEFASLSVETDDPLSEKRYSPLPRLVHQYPSRILIRATGECPLFCRHCFRRNLIPSERNFIGKENILKIRDYLAIHDEVREVLVSGGDPLSASNAALQGLFQALREGRPGILIRLCTRAPVSLPSRVDSELLSMLARYKPLKVVIQVNHRNELSEACKAAIEAILSKGIQVRSQTVLLKGINDSADALEALFSDLARLGADPYYLFQGDLARGSAHFRVALSKGLGIYEELRKRLSGLELPRFAVDAPGGGGKLYLPESLAGKENNEEGEFWLLRSPDGSLYRYPEES